MNADQIFYLERSGDGMIVDRNVGEEDAHGEAAVVAERNARAAT